MMALKEGSPCSFLILLQIIDVTRSLYFKNHPLPSKITLTDFNLFEKALTHPKAKVAT